MMTKPEVAAEYTVTEHGTVASFGKFEGEPWYAVALWDSALSGFADCEIGDENPVSWFKVSAELATELGLNVAAFDNPIGSWIGVWEDDSGFVRLTSSAIDPETAGSGYTDCACRDCFEIAISNNVTKLDLCNECADAGCSDDGESECQREPSFDCEECNGTGVVDCDPRSCVADECHGKTPCNTCNQEGR